MSSSADEEDHGGGSFLPVYGGVMPADFGGTDSLFRFTLPIPSPPSSVVRTQGVPFYDQRGFPTCTAAATAALLQLGGATVDTQIEELAVAFLYLAGKKLVMGHTEVMIENQADGGLPLAACIQAICLFGAVPRKDVPEPDDPVKLSQWMKAHNETIETLSTKYATLPGNQRPLRIYPSLDSLRAAILGGKAMAFSYRIGPIADRWMQRRYLSRGSPTFPPLDEVGPRLATHASVIVGYDDSREAFLVRNSFGVDWGLNGYYWIGYGTVLRPSFSGSEFYALG